MLSYELILVFEFEPENSPESNEEVVVNEVFEHSCFDVSREFG
jgi:hypothetical protein